MGDRFPLIVGSTYKEIEIRNRVMKYVYYGGVLDVRLHKREELRVTLSWLAKGEGYPRTPKVWIRKRVPDYRVTLVGALIERQDKYKRLFLRATTGDLIYLYKEKRFDRSKLRDG